ncbi:hypothetical protein CLOP_g23486 [Closterium sp. NIES-67]|nr:hypothetical protein CLOP_g23486 [Closterium sp. NIES-67]
MAADLAAGNAGSEREELPVIFVSHGSPMAAIEEDETSAFWQRLGKQVADFPGLKAILVISAHWEADGPAIRVNSAAQPGTVHDFYGFPRDLYSLQYPVKGSPELAQRVVELLSANHIKAELDPSHGLDHGAWVPLRWMLPRGSIPVVQMSLHGGSSRQVGNAITSMQRHVELGRALKPLRREGVLVLASGGAVHNLRDIGPYFGTKKVASYVAPFDSLLDEAIAKAKSDEDMLSRLLALASHPLLPKAHPTIEHLLPLYVAAGAGTGAGDATPYTATEAASSEDGNASRESKPSVAPQKLFDMRIWTLSNAAFNFGHMPKPEKLAASA